MKENEMNRKNKLKKLLPTLWKEREIEVKNAQEKPHNHHLDCVYRAAQRFRFIYISCF